MFCFGPAYADSLLRPFIRFDCLMRPDTEFDLDESVPMGDLMLASSKLMTVGMVDLCYVSIDVF
jgi:hypothetical protein